MSNTIWQMISVRGGAPKSARWCPPKIVSVWTDHFSKRGLPFLVSLCHEFNLSTKYKCDFPFQIIIKWLYVYIRPLKHVIHYLQSTQCVMSLKCHTTVCAGHNMIRIVGEYRWSRNKVRKAIASDLSFVLLNYSDFGQVYLVQTETCPHIHFVGTFDMSRILSCRGTWK